MEKAGALSRVNKGDLMLSSLIYDTLNLHEL